MIDIALLRGPDADKIIEQIKLKEPGFDAQKLVELDKKHRELQTQIETLRAEKNQLSKSIQGPPTPEIRDKSSIITESLKTFGLELEAIDAQLQEETLHCPNFVDKEVPAGHKESNQKIREWGDNVNLDFEPKNHLELNEKLNWFDFKAGARIGGSRQILYRGDGLKMLYALTRMMIKHNVEHGFEPVLPPYLVTRETMVSNGSLPKFAGDFYDLNNGELCLLPTSEVTFTGLYTDTILDLEKLPVRHCAWTSCFRREAGGYGATERGLIRIHQFEKVELYTLCKPEESESELSKMIDCAEKFVQKLGLHYQVSLLAAQDCSFPSAKTFDIEVWLPGQNAYYEVSSASNCTDFQARRAKIRYKDEHGKNHLVHTLNASSLALPRLMVALIESGQQADGTIKLPEILQKEMDAIW